MTVLDEIVAKKRQEIEAAKAATPLEELQKEAVGFKPDRRPFNALFRKGRVLIAEIKPKSPSAGVLTQAAPLYLAELYGKSEADVISVLTDKEYFGGSLSLLKDVRAKVPQPVFRKDFIIDEYQVYETFLSGADAFLLIANILSADELNKLMAIAQALDLGCIVEVHDEAELSKALNASPLIVGINNRNLKTMEVDVHTSERLLQDIPPGTFAVSESGIETAADVRKVREWGARGILVGTSILRSEDPVEKIKELKAALV